MAAKRGNLYSVTLNPALDLSGHVDDIIPNEKNSVHRARLDPGGNAINAARIAHRLGAKSVLLGFLGGPAGEQISSLLKQEGLLPQFMPISGRTRTNVTVTNDRTHQQTRLTFPGPQITRAESQALLRRIANLKGPGLLMLGGSAPPGLPANYPSQLVAAAQKCGLGVVVDVPARELTQILRAKGQKLMLIKPNQTELELWAGHKLSTVAAIIRETQRLLGRAVLVCVSQGKRGAIVAFRDQTWIIKAPRVKTRGSVGAGDSMVGAMVERLLQLDLLSPDRFEAATESQLHDILSWGAAAGAATAATEGTSLGSAALIQKLRKKVKIT